MLTISAKRSWQDGDYEYMECFCNGQHIVDRFKKDTHEGILRKKMVERVKDTCKCIKAGLPLDHATPYWTPEQWKVFHQTELPEWDQ